VALSGQGLGTQHNEKRNRQKRAVGLPDEEAPGKLRGPPEKKLPCSGGNW